MSALGERARRYARRAPRPVRAGLARIVSSRRLRRAVRPVRWGSLRGLEPVSRRFGFDRGTPVDRIYLRRFFGDHRGDMRGRVLEVGWPEFSDPYGTAESIEIVDIDGRNDRATIIADLSDPESLPTAQFDCIVLPQTLQYVSDLDAAIANVWQALAPGGVLLVTVPCIAKLDHNAREVDAWRLLPRGLQLLLERGCPGGAVTIVGYGNVLSAVAFLMGAAAEELETGALETDDADYPMLAAARVAKAVAG